MPRIGNGITFYQASRVLVTRDLNCGFDRMNIKTRDNRKEKVK